MREWSIAYNFLRDDRDQPFLLPPDLRDWLPADHLAWFVLDVVDQVDLGPFYRAHRDDGHGHPAYDPKLLLGVLLYGYCLGVRSSRQLEQAVQRTVPFGMLTMSLVVIWYALHGHHPDDVTDRRARQPWYTTKTEPSFADMLAKLRRTIIAARFLPERPGKATPEQINAVHLAWASAAA